MYSAYDRYKHLDSGDRIYSGTTIVYRMVPMAQSTLSGVLADRSLRSFPDANNKPTLLESDADVIYINEATGTPFKWLGDEWIILDGGSRNVKDYGAVGDGVTDDTDSIRLAIVNAEKVYFPEGTYLTETIKFPYNYYPHNTPALKPLEIIGESMYSTVLVQKNSSQPVVAFDGYPSYGNVLSNFTIKPNPDGFGGSAIDMTGCLKCRVENIVFADNKAGYFNEGISLHAEKNGAYIICHENYVSNISVNNAIGPSILIVVGSGTNPADAPHLNYFDRITVQSCDFPASKVVIGFLAYTGFNIFLTNSHFEGINGIGVLFGSAIFASCISNSYIEKTQSSISNYGAISVYNTFISGAVPGLENKIQTRRPINFVGCHGDPVGATTGALGLSGEISGNVITSDYLNGGLNGGAMIEISSNANQALVQFNQYYGDYAGQGVRTIRRSRKGSAGQIQFAPNDIPFSNIKAGDIGFAISSPGDANDPISYKTILSLNQRSLNMPNILAFANNVEAIAGGLIVGDLYRTNELVKIVY